MSRMLKKANEIQWSKWLARKGERHGRGLDFNREELHDTLLNRPWESNPGVRSRGYCDLTIWFVPIPKFSLSATDRASEPSLIRTTVAKSIQSAYCGT